MHGTSRATKKKVLWKVESSKKLFMQFNIYSQHLVFFWLSFKGKKAFALTQKNINIHEMWRRNMKTFSLRLLVLARKRKKLDLYVAPIKLNLF